MLARASRRVESRADEGPERSRIRYSPHVSRPDERKQNAPPEKKGRDSVADAVPEPSLVGRIIGKRYQLVRMLGDGGMGAVYKSADQVLRRFVAIKMLHPSTARNPAAGDRFQREARAAAAIGHPNIIDILDFGMENGRPFMVMEYLRGRSLSQLLATEGRLGIARSCSIAAHTLAGLAAAHERGILHRDLKPANLMIIQRYGDRNFVKVCDFGFAALMGHTTAEDGKTLTPERTLVGTPAYAAPERLRGDDRRDPRTDVYSVGVVLFEMIAGRRPFDAPTFAELAKKVRNEPPPSLRAVRSDVPEALDRVIQRALSKAIDERWKNAGDLAAALVPFGGRNVTLEDDHPSDSFAFEVLELKARDAKKRGTRPSLELPDGPGSGKEIVTGQAPRVPPGPITKAPPARASTAPASDRTLRAPAVPREALVPGPLAPPIVPPIHGPLGARGESAPAAVAPAAIPHRAPVAPPSSIEVPIDVPEPESDHDTQIAMQVRGRVVLSVLRFVARRFGERALRELLSSMPESARRPFDLGIEPEMWVDGNAFRTLVESIDARLGSDDLHTIVECGRASAEGAFEDMRALEPPAPPPELVLSEMPQVASGLFRGIEIVVRRLGKGYGRLELIEMDAPSLTSSVLVLGFLERSLERFGAEEVEVNMLGARALDDVQTLIDVSWLA
jgi:serine/threonine protein kinase